MAFSRILVIGGTFISLTLFSSPAVGFDFGGALKGIEKGVKELEKGLQQGQQQQQTPPPQQQTSPPQEQTSPPQEQEKRHATNPQLKKKVLSKKKVLCGEKGLFGIPIVIQPCSPCNSKINGKFLTKETSACLVMREIMGLKSNIINGLKKQYPNIENTEIKYYFRGNHPGLALGPQPVFPGVWYGITPGGEKPLEIGKDISVVDAVGQHHKDKAKHTRRITTSKRFNCSATKMSKEEYAICTQSQSCERRVKKGKFASIEECLEKTMR